MSRLGVNSFSLSKLLSELLVSVTLILKLPLILIQHLKLVNLLVILSIILSFLKIDIFFSRYW